LKPSSRVTGSHCINTVAATRFYTSSAPPLLSIALVRGDGD
jgi:hypothetical protein